MRRKTVKRMEQRISTVLLILLIAAIIVAAIRIWIGWHYLEWTVWVGRQNFPAPVKAWLWGW